MLVIYDTLTDMPDIIIVQFIEPPSISEASLHLTCVPFLSVVAVKLKLVVSPGLFILTRATINPVLGALKTCPKELTVPMAVLSDEGEYQCAKLPFIVQVSAPCVCGHTLLLQSRLVTEAFILPVVNLSTFYFIMITSTHLSQLWQYKL